MAVGEKAVGLAELQGRQPGVALGTVVPTDCLSDQIKFCHGTDSLGPRYQTHHVLHDRRHGGRTPSGRTNGASDGGRCWRSAPRADRRPSLFHSDGRDRQRVHPPGATCSQTPRLTVTWMMSATPGGGWGLAGPLGSPRGGSLGGMAGHCHSRGHQRVGGLRPPTLRGLLLMLRAPAAVGAERESATPSESRDCASSDMAPAVGLEPTTCWLTASRSAS